MADMEADLQILRTLFGERVREVRTQRNLTQMDLAELLGKKGVRVSQSTVAKLENGQRPTPIEEAVVVAQILGVTLSYLLAFPSATSDDLERDRALFQAALASAEQELRTSRVRVLEARRAVAEAEAQSEDARATVASLRGRLDLLLDVLAADAERQPESPEGDTDVEHPQAP